MAKDTRKIPSHFWPRTRWRKFYLAWFLLCLLMVWFGTWAVNRPVALLGLPLVYVWCSGWGVLWLSGCLYCGIQIERGRGGGG